MRSWCKSPAAISYRIRDGQAIAGGVLRYLTAARPLGGKKRKGETPTGELSTSSTVIHPTSRRARELVEGCCSFTGHSNCSTAGPYACACKFHTSVQQCTGCYCWVKCKNKGRLTRPIANIFVPTGDIGGRGRGRGKGREGRCERLQGPEGGRGERRQRRKEERKKTWEET